MRTIWMTLFGLFLVGISAAPRDAAALEGPLALGIEGGVNYGTASAPTDIGKTNRTGIMGGLNFELPVAGAFSIVPELLYLQTESGLTDSRGVSLHTSYDSLELPVLLKASIPGPVSPYAFIGPNFIWNLSKNVSGGGAGGSVSFTPRSTDWAIDAGVGLKLSALFANLRYSYLLTGSEGATVNWRSRGLQLLVGLQFPL